MSRPHGTAGGDGSAWVEQARAHQGGPDGAQGSLLVPAEEVTVLVTDGSSFGAAERGLWHHCNIGATLPRRLWREKDAIAIVSAEGSVDAEAAAAVLSSRRKKRRAAEAGEGAAGHEEAGVRGGIDGKVTHAAAATSSGAGVETVRMTSESLSSRATFQVTPSTQANYLYARYRFALVIDVSPSMFALDVHSCRLPFHDVLPAVQTWLTALAAPMSTARLAEAVTVPAAAIAAGKSSEPISLGLLERVTYRPEVHLTVLAQYRGRNGHCAATAPPARVLLHGGLLTAATLADTIQRLARGLLVVEEEFKQLVEAEGSAASGAAACAASDSAASPPSLGPAIEAATRAVSMLPADACPAVVLVSDCVSSAPLELDYGNLLMQLVRHDTTLHVIQLGTCSGVHATLGSVPDVDDAQLLAVGTNGVRIRARDLKLLVEPPPPEPGDAKGHHREAQGSAAPAPATSVLAALAPSWQQQHHAAPGAGEGALIVKDGGDSLPHVALAASNGGRDAAAGLATRAGSSHSGGLASDAVTSPSRYADALCTALASKAAAAGSSPGAPLTLRGGAGGKVIHARRLAAAEACVPEGSSAGASDGVYHRLFKPTSMPLGGALSVELWALTTSTASSAEGEGEPSQDCAVAAAAPSRHPSFSVRCLTPLQRFMYVRSSTTPPPSTEGTSSSSQMLARVRAAKTGGTGGALVKAPGAPPRRPSLPAGGSAVPAAGVATSPVPSTMAAPLYRVLSRADFLFPWSGPPPPIPYLRLTLAQTRFKLPGQRSPKEGSDLFSLVADAGGMDTGLLIGLRLHEGFHLVSGGPHVGSITDQAGRIGTVEASYAAGASTPVPGAELYAAAGGIGLGAKPRASLPGLAATSHPSAGGVGAGGDAHLLASDVQTADPTVLVLQWQPHIMIEYVITSVQRRWIRAASGRGGAGKGKRGAAAGAGAAVGATAGASSKPPTVRARGAAAATSTASSAGVVVASERYLQVTITLVGRQDFVRLYAASVSETAVGTAPGPDASKTGAKVPRGTPLPSTAASGAAPSASAEANNNRLLHRLPPGSVELRRVKALGNVLRVLQQADQVLAHLCSPALPPAPALAVTAGASASASTAGPDAASPDVATFLRFFAQFGSLSQALWHRWFDVEQLEVAVTLDNEKSGVGSSSNCNLFPSTRTTVLAAERVLIDKWADAALPVLHNGGPTHHHHHHHHVVDASGAKTFIRFVHPVLRGSEGQEGSSGKEGAAAVAEGVSATEAAATGINEAAAVAGQGDAIGDAGASSSNGNGQRMLPFVLVRVVPVVPADLEEASGSHPSKVGGSRVRTCLVHFQLAFFGCAPPQRAAELQRLVQAMTAAPHALPSAPSPASRPSPGLRYRLQVLPASVQRMLLRPVSATDAPLGCSTTATAPASESKDPGEICCGFLDLPQRFLRAVLWQRRWQYRLAASAAESAASTAEPPPAPLQSTVLALLEAGMGAATSASPDAPLQQWTLVRAVDSVVSGPATAVAALPRAYRQYARLVQVSLDGDTSGCCGGSGGNRPPRLCLAQSAFAVSCDRNASGCWEVVVDASFAMEPVEGHVAAASGRVTVETQRQAPPAEGRPAAPALVAVTGASCQGRSATQTVSTRALFTALCRALHASAYRALLTTAAAAAAGKEAAREAARPESVTAQGDADAATPGPDASPLIIDTASSAAVPVSIAFTLSTHTADALNHAFCLSSAGQQAPLASGASLTATTVDDVVYTLAHGDKPGQQAAAEEETAAPAALAPAPATVRVARDPPPCSFTRRQPLHAPGPATAVFARELIWRPAGVALHSATEVLPAAALLH